MPTFENLLEDLCIRDEDPPPTFSVSWPYGPGLGPPLTVSWLYAHPECERFVAGLDALGFALTQFDGHFFIRQKIDEDHKTKA